jgi:hypothetical protein
MGDTDVGLHLFVALAEEDYEKVMGAGELTADYFASDWCPWVPFKESAEAAVESALRSTKFGHGPWATEGHVWCVLKVRLTPQQVLDVVRSKVLRPVWPANDVNFVGGFRWHGPFQLCGHFIEWTRADLFPTTLDGWANRRLTVAQGYHIIENSTCAGCGGVGRLWQAGYYNQPHCSGCWRNFFVDTR